MSDREAMTNGPTITPPADDLAAQLRRAAEMWNGEDADQAYTLFMDNSVEDLFTQAADEIERLRRIERAARKVINDSYGGLGDEYHYGSVFFHELDACLQEKP